MSRTLGPEPLPALLEEYVEEHRHLFCARYDACLDRAARGDWASWTCEHCARFQRLRRARVQAPARRALARQQAAGTACRRPATGPESRLAARPGAAATPACARPAGDTARRRPSAAALFVEAGRAVAEVIGGRPLAPTAEWAEEVSIAAPDRVALLDAWIEELVRRSVRSNVRFEELDIAYLSERRLVASIRGARVAQEERAVETLDA